MSTAERRGFREPATDRFTNGSIGVHRRHGTGGVVLKECENCQHYAQCQITADFEDDRKMLHKLRSKYGEQPSLRSLLNNTILQGIMDRIRIPYSQLSRDEIINKLVSALDYCPLLRHEHKRDNSLLALEVL